MYIFQFLRQVAKFTSRLFIIFTVLGVISILFFSSFRISKTSKTLSSEEISKKQKQEIYQFFNNPEFKKTKQGQLYVGVVRSIFCPIVGEGCAENQNDKKNDYQKSMFGKLGSLLTFSYAIPPASGIYYTYDALQNAGFIPEAYASEGIGFAALSPLLGVWKLFRNVAYFILVFALVIVGFMIMFRTKVDPQTVISLENSLPRIIITLILITFSFAIAGLLIDLMYVLLAFSMSIINSTFAFPPAVQKEHLEIMNGGGNLLRNIILWESKYWFIGPALLQLLPQSIASFIHWLIGFITVTLLAQWDPFHFISGEFLNGIGLEILAEGTNLGGLLPLLWKLEVWLKILIPLFSGIAPFIISLFVFFTAAFLLIRIFFLLFKSYLEILLIIIFSPIILLFDVFPGRGMFSFWLRKLIANLVIFPLIAIFLALPSIIFSATSSISAPLWQPPFMHSVSPGAYIIIISMGIIFVIPDVIKVVKKTISPSDTPLRIGIGTFFGGVSAPIQGGMSTFGHIGSLGYTLHALQNSPFGKFFGGK